MTNFGGIEVVHQTAMKNFPQRAASAWATMNDFVGASYRPIAYVGTQIVKGTNHIFIAEQTLVLENPVRHIVLVTINEFNGEFTPVNITNII